MSRTRGICMHCDQLARSLGGTASCQNGVCVVSLLRDIDVTILGRRSRSPLVLPVLLSFESPDEEGQALCLGETVILPREVNRFLTVLRRFGITITALHNHWLFEEPRLMYLHWIAIMRPDQFVTAVKEAFAAIGEMLGPRHDEEHDSWTSYEDGDKPFRTWTQIIH